MGYIKSRKELPNDVILYGYQDKEIFQKMREFSIEAEPKHKDYGRTQREKKRDIFIGKANEFAMHYIFFKDFYNEPDLIIHDGDDGGFDTTHVDYDVKLDYKVRSFTKDYFEFRSNILRSDFYVFNYDIYIHIDSSQIWVAEPVIYSKKSIIRKLESSYDVTKKMEWFVRKINLKAIQLKSVLTRPEDFI